MFLDPSRSLGKDSSAGTAPSGCPAHKVWLNTQGGHPAQQQHGQRAPQRLGFRYKARLTGKKTRATGGLP